MKTIFKYQLKTDHFITLSLHKGAQVLHVQVQNRIPCLWVIVDTEATMEERSFVIYGTGHEITHDSVSKQTYIGTYQLYGGNLVFHVFELKNTQYNIINTSNESLHRTNIEAIAEQFRINEGFTEDANISYISGFDKGANWQKEKDKVVINKLIEALNNMCTQAEHLALWDKMESNYYNAKKLLQSIEQKQ